MDLPRYIQLEPVGQCNLRCQMCPIQFRNDGPADGRPAFMAFDLFQRMIDQIPNLEHLHLQGLGEPMLHPKFFDMVEYAVSKRIRVTTNTNLTVLSPTRADRCVSSGLDRVHVSVDGATPETYASIRIRGRLERVERNLGFLRKARTKANSDKPDIRLVLVIMKQNLEELPDIVRLAHGWGCSSVFVQHLCHDFHESSLPDTYRPMRDFVDVQSLIFDDPNRVAKYFGEANVLANQLGIELRLPRTTIRSHPPGTPGRDRCNWPWHGIYASYQGLAMPCCMISTPDRLNFGSFETIPVDKIWNSSSYEHFRADLASDRPPEICQSCSVYHGVF
jgi:MoaA/NifB/PqqE/SkfB family radical SAM enzyme